MDASNLSEEVRRALVEVLEARGLTMRVDGVIYVARKTTEGPWKVWVLGNPDVYWYVTSDYTACTCGEDRCVHVRALTDKDTDHVGWKYQSLRKRPKRWPGRES